jgi:hypothetical protein
MIIFKINVILRIKTKRNISFLFFNVEWSDFINIIQILKNNYEYIFYLSLLHSIYILYKKSQDLDLNNKLHTCNEVINKSTNFINNEINNESTNETFNKTNNETNNDTNNVNNNKIMSNMYKKLIKKTINLLIILFIIGFLYDLYLDIKNYSIYSFRLDNDNIIIYRKVKLLLGVFIAIISLSTNIKDNGFKSWKTILSLLSFCLLILYACLLYNEIWKTFINDKIKDYLGIILLVISSIISNNIHMYDGCSVKSIYNEVDYKLKGSILAVNNNGEPGYTPIQTGSPTNESSSNKPSTSSNTNTDDKDLRPSTAKSTSSQTSTLSSDSTISHINIAVLSKSRDMSELSHNIAKDWRENKLSLPKEKSELIEKVLEVPEHLTSTYLLSKLEREEKKAFEWYCVKRGVSVDSDKKNILNKAKDTINKMTADPDNIKKGRKKIDTFLSRQPDNDYDIQKNFVVNNWSKGEFIDKDSKNAKDHRGIRKELGGINKVYDLYEKDAENSIEEGRKTGKYRSKAKARIWGKLSFWQFLNKINDFPVDLFKKGSNDVNVISQSSVIKNNVPSKITTADNLISDKNVTVNAPLNSSDITPSNITSGHITPNSTTNNVIPSNITPNAVVKDNVTSNNINENNINDNVKKNVQNTDKKKTDERYNINFLLNNK